MKKRMLRWGGYVWREWLRPAAVIAAIVFPFKSAIADWNWVPTGSMKPTILEGDLVLVNKLAYDLKLPFTLFRLAAWSNPARGDVVVFFSPYDGTRLVKRVIGVPGDTLELRDNVLFRNGQAMDYQPIDARAFAREIHEDSGALIAEESDGEHKHLVMALPSRSAMRSFAPITVPEGQYFVMGDSRDNSFDSRFYGLVDRERIVGRSRRVALSFDKNHSYLPRMGRTLSALDKGR